MRPHDPPKGYIPWRTVPLRTRIIFLTAVFCIFAGIGFANDIIDMGRWPPQRFVFSVLLIGVCAMGYAASGVILRNKFWKVMVPLMVVQTATMAFLARQFPDAPQPIQLNAAETDRLHSRMAFDGAAVIVLAVLGYVGFVQVSVSEARRFARTQTEKAKLEAEMAAAREVQRVMVPDDSPPVPGYSVESVYRPAAEVGGDFFQVIPLKSSGTLLVIGDVSGKGLRAAMIVSMIVGILRTLTAYTEEPAEILAELNRRECGRTESGFATCLVLRLEAGGKLTLANAGHPPPYLNGVELDTAGSLPLGLTDAAEYTQENLQIDNADRLVLLTDGVPEARNAQGQLFGFPRLEEMVRNAATARTIADAAQQHGQDDDVTVISIVRQA